MRRYGSCKPHDLFLSCPAGEFACEPAFAHDENAVGHLNQFGKLGTHHEDSSAGTNEPVHFFEYFLLGADVDAAGRFIEQEDARAPSDPFGDDDLLLIAAAETAGKLRDGAATDTKPVAKVFGKSGLFSFLENAKATDASEVGHGDVGSNGQLQGETILLPVFGNESDTRGHGFTRGARRDRLAGYLDGAARGRIQTEDDTAEFRSTGTHQSRQADDFTGANLERDVPKETAADVVDAEKNVAGHPSLAAKDGIDGATDHVLDELLAREVLQRAGVHRGAVTKNRDAIADRAEFVEPVSDVYDRELACREFPDDTEDLMRFGFRERGRGLIEDQQTRALRNGAADFNELFSRRRKTVNAHFRIQTEAVFLYYAARFTDNRATVDPTGFAFCFAAEIDVFGDGEVAGKERFLVHHSDSIGGRFRRASERDGPTSPKHVAPVFAVHARNDLHECGFAGAVFTHEQMHFAFVYFEIAVAQSFDATEVLLNMIEREEQSESLLQADLLSKRPATYAR